MNKVNGTGESLPKKNMITLEEVSNLIQPIYDDLVSSILKKTSIKITNAKYMEIYTKIVNYHDSNSIEDKKSQKKNNPNDDKMLDLFKTLVRDFAELQKKELMKIEYKEQFFLEKVIEIWKDFSIFLFWMIKMFYYLEIFFLKGMGSSLTQEGLLVFRSFFFFEIKERLTKIIIGYISSERNGHIIPGELVKVILSYFNVMGHVDKTSIYGNKSTNEYYFTVKSKINDAADSDSYNKYFLAPFLVTKIDHFQKKVQDEWSKLSTPEYVNIALMCLQEEERLADYYFPSSKMLIIKEIVKVIVENMASNDHTGILCMLQNNNRDELKKIYLLFNLVPYTKQLIALQYWKYLNDIVKKFNEKQNFDKNPIEFVTNIVENKKQSDEIIENIFENDLEIIQARDWAFKGFLNISFEKLSNIYLRYIDIAFKRNELKIFDELFETIAIYYASMSNISLFPLYYKKYFETPLLSIIENHYQNKVHVEWVNFSTSEYVDYALKSLKEEEQSSFIYYPAPKNLIIKLIEEIVIEDKVQELSSSESCGILHMLKNNMRNELKEIYLLFKRVTGAVQQISSRYQTYLEELGNSFNEDQSLNKNPLGYIKNVLELYERSEELIKNIFENNISLMQARDSAFRGFLNSFDRSVKFLAIYSDTEFKKGIKGLTDQEIDSKFQQFINILRFLHSRDAFLKDYTKFLSDRLLNNTSLNEESENSMLSKLKNELGINSVSSIVKMKLDIKESFNEMKDFFSYLAEEKLNLNYIEFNVKVLTDGCWPEFWSRSEFVVPAKLKDLTDSFVQFYTKKYNQARKISWVWSKGSSELIAKFDKSYYLQVTNIQLIVLLALNDSQSETFESLLKRTGISEGDFVSHMDFLFKIKLLVRKKDAQDEFERNELISINKDFSSNQKRLICLRIKAPSRLTKFGTTLKDDPCFIENESLQKERNSFIDAVAVRVMKARKRIELQELVKEIVILITLFRPQGAQIKNRIESLIERGFIERSEDNKFLIYLP